MSDVSFKLTPMYTHTIRSSYVNDVSFKLSLTYTHTVRSSYVQDVPSELTLTYTNHTNSSLSRRKTCFKSSVAENPAAV